MTDISKRLAEIRDDIREGIDESARAGFPLGPTDWIDIRLRDVLGPLSAVEKVQEWATGDVVTAKSSFGDGYREAMRDIRDLLAAALETGGDKTDD